MRGRTRETAGPFTQGLRRAPAPPAGLVVEDALREPLPKKMSGKERSCPQLSHPAPGPRALSPTAIPKRAVFSSRPAGPAAASDEATKSTKPTRKTDDTRESDDSLIARKSCRQHAAVARGVRARGARELAASCPDRGRDPARKDNVVEFEREQSYTLF